MPGSPTSKDAAPTRRRRLYIEVGLALITAIAAIVTLLSPEWIEDVFGIDPDQGSGALEWAIVGGFAVAAIAFAALARVEWRRPMPSGA